MFNVSVMHTQGSWKPQRAAQQVGIWVSICDYLFVISVCVRVKLFAYVLNVFFFKVVCAEIVFLFYFCRTARSRMLRCGQQDAVLQSGGAGVSSRPAKCRWAQSGPAVAQPALLGAALGLRWAWTSSQAQFSWQQWVPQSVWCCTYTTYLCQIQWFSHPF